MVKNILIECERSFRVLNLCLGNGEVHRLNEKEMFAVLRLPGKIKMYEVSLDRSEKVLITKDNYTVATKFASDANPAAPVEVKTEVVPPVVEKKVEQQVYQPKHKDKKKFKAEAKPVEVAPVVEETPVPVVEETPVVVVEEVVTPVEEVVTEEAPVVEVDPELAALEREIAAIEEEEKK